MDDHPGGVVFTAVDAAMVRVAVLESVQGDIDWPRFDAPEDGQVEHWRGWLRQMWQNAPFVAAIEAATPSLVERVRKILSGSVDSVTTVQSTVESVLRYLLRARSRATPFGLFAGVAPARFGPMSAVRVDAESTATGRVDAAWLAGMVAVLRQQPSVRDHLSVVLANTCVVRDGRLVLGLRRSPSPDQEPAEISVRHTPLVELLAASTRQPISVADLVNTLLQAFPDTGAPAAIAVIELLIEQHMLVTNLTPPSTCTDPCGHVLATLATTRALSDPACTSAMTDLRCARDRLNQPTTNRRARPTSIDLRAGVSITLPDAVAREAARAATVLTRLTGFPHGRPAWADYHQRFLERYGPGAAIPLLSLIDPDIGLGLPGSYRGSLFAEPVAPATDRDRQLSGLAQRAALERRTEVNLTAALIDELAGTGPIVSPPHLELTTRIHSTSLAALNRNEFTLAVVGVFRAAGTTTGRFLDILTTADRERMIDTYARLPAHHADAVRAQLSCPPLHIESENVTRHPRVLPQLLPINEHHPTSDSLLALDDLLVIGDTQGLMLWSRTQDQPVEPHLFTAASLITRAHPLLRFLCEITTARCALPGPFSWGLAEHLPFLPALRYHRTLLAPARWTLTAHHLPDHEWDCAFTRWRDTMMVPDTVHLGTGDRRLTLDLTEPAHRHLVRRQLRQRQRATLSEAPTTEAFGWLDGRAHEITIPLATTQPPVPPPIRTHPATGTADSADLPAAHLPGAGDWLSCVLVSHPDRHTDLLATHLPGLLDHLHSPRPLWWYVPYRDPGHHLRLRLHLPDSDTRAAAITQIGRWADRLRNLGVLTLLRFDTYWPELGRYGGPTAITAAETVFATDSTAALAQRIHAPTLNITDMGGEPATVLTPAAAMTAITAAGLLNIAISLAGDTTTGCRWLQNHTPSVHHHAANRPLYTASLAFAHPHTGQTRLASLPGGNHILTTWDQRRLALQRYCGRLLTEQKLAPQAVLASLLHLHCVRALGIGSEHEPASLHLARAAARAHLAQRHRP
jgi:thiopeptide-type bacteriocin biosynthesis protein